MRIAGPILGDSMPDGIASCEVSMTPQNYIAMTGLDALQNTDDAKKVEANFVRRGEM